MCQESVLAVNIWHYGCTINIQNKNVKINLNCNKKINKKSRRKYLKDCTPFNAKNVKHAYLN